MMGRELLLLSQATSLGLVISEMASINANESFAIVSMTNWVLASYAAAGALALLDDQNKQYLYDTVKLDSYGPYLRTQTTEIRQACRELNRSFVLCTLTGVRPIES